MEVNPNQIKKTHLYITILLGTFSILTIGIYSAASQLKIEETHYDLSSSSALSFLSTVQSCQPASFILLIAWLRTSSIIATCPSSTPLPAGLLLIQQHLVGHLLHHPSVGKLPCYLLHHQPVGKHHVLFQIDHLPPYHPVGKLPGHLQLPQLIGNLTVLLQYGPLLYQQ